MRYFVKNPWWLRKMFSKRVWEINTEKNKAGFTSRPGTLTAVVVYITLVGSLQEAEQIISLGFLLGIGGVVTYKNGGLDKVLPAISLQHIVMETDAPYLAPVPYRGKRNETAYLPKIADAIANIKKLDVTEVIAATSANADRVFNNS